MVFPVIRHQEAQMKRLILTLLVAVLILAIAAMVMTPPTIAGSFDATNTPPPVPTEPPPTNTPAARAAGIYAGILGLSAGG